MCQPRWPQERRARLVRAEHTPYESRMGMIT